MVPKIIHQIWIGDEPIPEHCKEFSKEMQSMHPNWEYKLWGNELLYDIYSNDKYIKHYLTNPHIYKWAFTADRIRMLLLKEYGGVYCDLDAKPIRPFDFILDRLNENHTFFGGVRPFQEHNNTPPLIDVTVIGATPESRMINYILSLYGDVNRIWMGKTMSDEMWKAIEPDTALFNYKYFYDNKITDETVVLHDIDNQRLWSWNDGDPV